MELIRFGSATVLFILSLLSSSASAFSGEFEISGLEIDAPFQADPKSTKNTTVSFVFNDQNTPKASPASCSLTWAVGLSPPSQSLPGVCSDRYVRAWLPSGTYNGVADFQIEITHTYEDNTIGDPPYNINTLFGFLNLTSGDAGEMSNYTCDMARANCRSVPETIMIAKVLYAFS
ncbi:hypothetical protein EPUS_02870 [Endocarpon pusillum Z07020]|uniref:Ubiquitin 3 binding protein But2 C-terminal domain-containing protein n=1 Tax=Endocarpon pusillum (strain Z07020 / HMAS-L-300199) TaxID=1263415 RepID=U1GK79_ENDPU|nr:uncharacterized protein EPUS_02870 [Endocarpon pusillum Z07020]ERF72588.1 hypothetical protein EPUS_02870 [Endocarpon pusillum Z07020]